jgi:hypothetical protein
MEVVRTEPSNLVRIPWTHLTVQNLDLFNSRCRHACLCQAIEQHILDNNAGKQLS